MSIWLLMAGEAIFCKTATEFGSNWLNGLNGVQPAMMLPGVPHFTTPSVSMNDGPRSLFIRSTLGRPRVIVFEDRWP